MSKFVKGLAIGVFVLVAATAFASDTGRKDSYVFRDGGITWNRSAGFQPAGRAGF